MRIHIHLMATVVGLAALGAAPSSFAQLVINEYVYDDQGTDDREFVELYNSSGTTLDVSGWSLIQINGNDGTATTTDPIATDTLAPGQYWVIGQVGVDNLDQIASGAFQNNGAEGFEVRDAGWRPYRWGDL